MGQAGKFTVAVDIPEDAFGVRNADFDAVKKKFRSREVSVTVTPGAEQDESIKLQEAGELREIPSVVFEDGSIAFTTNPEGLGSGGAGDGVPAVNTWLSHLLSSLSAEAAVNDTGDSILAAPPPTTTAFDEATPGAHAVKGFIGVTLDSKFKVRPILSYAAGSIGLAFALPSAPAGLEELYASTHGRFLEFASLPCQLEVLGNSQPENNEAYGVQMNSLSIAEVESGKVPSLAFNGRCATGLHQNAGTRTIPGGQRPTVLAGGDVIIGGYGSTVYDALKFGRPSVEINRSYEAIEDPNDDKGLCGWEPITDSTIRLMLKVPQDTSKTGSVPPAALTAATWFELWEQYDEEFIHAQLTFGLAAGRVLAFYFPKLQLQLKPEPDEVRGLSAWMLTFAPPEGMTEDAYWWGIL